MARLSDTDEPGAKPQVLVAIPYSRAAVVLGVAAVVLPASFLVARAAWSLRPGGIGPGPADPTRVFLLLAIVAVGALLSVIGFRAPAFAVLKDGLKLPINRIAPGRSLRDPWARGFYSWDELSYCRWSPYQPGVLSVHLDAAVHQTPVVFGPASRGQMTVPPTIYFYRVPARHRAAVEAAIRSCGKWAD
jgi:hypothetical protein